MNLCFTSNPVLAFCDTTTTAAAATCHNHLHHSTSSVNNNNNISSSTMGPPPNACVSSTFPLRKKPSNDTMTHTSDHNCSTFESLYNHHHHQQQQPAVAVALNLEVPAPAPTIHPAAAAAADRGRCRGTGSSMVSNPLEYLTNTNHHHFTNLVAIDEAPAPPFYVMPDDANIQNGINTPLCTTKETCIDPFQLVAYMS